MYRIVKYETTIGDRYVVEELNNDGVWRVVFRYNKSKGISRCSFDTLAEAVNFAKEEFIGQAFVLKQQVCESDSLRF